MICEKAAIESGLNCTCKTCICDDYYMDCTNPNCDWQGLKSKCYDDKEKIETLCPVCLSITEPAQIY